MRNLLLALFFSLSILIYSQEQASASTKISSIEIEIPDFKDSKVRKFAEDYSTALNNLITGAQSNDSRILKTTEKELNSLNNRAYKINKKINDQDKKKLEIYLNQLKDKIEAIVINLSNNL